MDRLQQGLVRVHPRASWSHRAQQHAGATSPHIDLTLTHIDLTILLTPLLTPSAHLYLTVGSRFAQLAFAFEVAHSTLKLSPQSGDGIQADGSFHQHGVGNTREFYSGWGYGAIFTTNILVLESYAKGTPFAMNASRWEVFAHFVLDGQASIHAHCCCV